MCAFRGLRGAHRPHTVLCERRPRRVRAAEVCDSVRSRNGAVHRAAPEVLCADGGKLGGEILRDIVERADAGCERVGSVDRDVFPVELSRVNRWNRRNDFHREDIADAGGETADVDDVEGIVVS